MYIILRRDLQEVRRVFPLTRKLHIPVLDNNVEQAPNLLNVVFLEFKFQRNSEGSEAPSQDKAGAFASELLHQQECWNRASDMVA